MQNTELVIEGIPSNVHETIASLYRSRLFTATNELFARAGLTDAVIKIGPRTIMNQIAPKSRESGLSSPDDIPIEVRAQQYKSHLPLFEFNQLVIPDNIKEDLLSAIDVIRVEKQVFHDWGLKKIEPFPRTCLNFHGRPGTGKTLAAHAIAQILGRHILIVSYAEIESKFHGDGPKNVQAIFYAAERDNAVLFIDEADSLLSKRLTEVNQGSEQAINSMRSQLFICLEGFRGIVVFATNLVENYDRAFETRVRHIHFPLPDEKGRREIWRRHLLPQLPQAPDVSIDYLAAEVDGICGRDIKNAVIDAAIRAARQNKMEIELSSLLAAIERIKKAREQVEALRKHNIVLQEEPLTNEEKQKITEQVRFAREMPPAQASETVVSS